MNTPRLRYRLMQRSDFAECLQVLPPWMQLPDALRAELPRIWSSLLGHIAVMPGVMEDLARPAGQRIQGFGYSVVLPADWGARFAHDPQPFLAWQLYAALQDGSLKLPDEREIGRANADGGVTLAVLHYAQLPRDLSLPYTHSVLVTAMEMFRLVHAGYRLRAIYQEGAGDDPAFLGSMGYRLQSEYAGHGIEGMAPDERPTLWGLTREQAAAQLPGTAVRHLFDHYPPLFGLSASQRRLLALALFEDSDEALCGELGVSTHGIKKLWRGIYERIEDRSPGFFGADAADADDGKRGREKRRQVLAYVRQRLEEVRPWLAA